jgi:nanoRNase/pAp phosphatase (c-di-AMP/oligoRNAs hydrolase)
MILTVEAKNYHIDYQKKLQEEWGKSSIQVLYLGLLGNTINFENSSNCLFFKLCVQLLRKAQSDRSVTETLVLILIDPAVYHIASLLNFKQSLAGHHIWLSIQ